MRTRYECPFCDWTYTAPVREIPAFTENALELHIATHPIGKHIMRFRVWRFRRALSPKEGEA